MANQHMISAAASLQKALSDIQLYKSEIQHNLDEAKRASNDRLKQIDQEVQTMRISASKTDSSTIRATFGNQMKQLEQEKVQINQTLADQERYASEQFHFAEQNTADINTYINRLQMMA